MGMCGNILCLSGSRKINYSVSLYEKFSTEYVIIEVLTPKKYVHIYLKLGTYKNKLKNISHKSVQ